MFQQAIEIQRQLRALEIPSVVIGGLAVALWGEPRLTRDVDLKIQLDRGETGRLLDALPADWQPLAADPAESFARFGFLFLQADDGTRFDLLLADNAFDRAAIGRGRVVELEPGMSLLVCAPEDLVIYKLISTRLRDHEDAQGVVRRQGDALDDEYIIQWLTIFEQALDDSTLVATYRRFRRGDGLD